MKKTFTYLLLILLSLNNNIVFAVSINKPLPPEQVFKAKLINKDQLLTIEFNIKNGYYLYKDKLQFEATPKITFKKLIFSKSQTYKDDFFGQQEIFRDYFKIDIPYTNLHKNKFDFNVKYQGCADQGICYNISSLHFKISKEGIYYPIKTGIDKKNKQNLNSSFLRLSQKFFIHKNILWINLIIFFITGLGLSFTACIYPIIPIIYSIILGTRNLSKLKAFILSLSYVHGVAISYVIIGLLATFTGNILTASLVQNPIFIIISDILIFILALSMFGVFNIQTPLKIQNYLNTKTQTIKGGKIFAVLIIGILSALIIGPCIGPALTFILSLIATNKNYLLGALYLYFLALGIGFPIILLCVFGIKILPKSGKWMDYIRIFFGFILIFTCIYISQAFLPYKLILISYFILFIVYAITLIYYSQFFNKIFTILCRLIGVLIIAYSLYFITLGMKLKTTFIHNLLILNPIKLNKLFTNEKDLNNAIIKAFIDNPHEPIYIEFYAKWCINCVKMQMQTLNTQYVKENINIKRFFIVDVTQNNQEQKQLLKKYKLFGPPAIFVLNSYNQISEPLIGFVSPKELITWINKYKYK